MSKRPTAKSPKLQKVQNQESPTMQKVRPPYKKTKFFFFRCYGVPEMAGLLVLSIFLSYNNLN